MWPSCRLGLGGALPTAPGSLLRGGQAGVYDRDQIAHPGWQRGSRRGRLQGLIELLRGQDDEELNRVFAMWVTTVLRMPSRLRSVDQDPLARLKEAQTMLEETVQEWTREWVEQGRAEGVEQGRAEGVEQGRAEGVEQGRAEGVEQGRAEGVEQERTLLCRLATRKFDATSGEGLSAALAGVTDPDRLAQVGDWIIECETGADLLARVRGNSRSDG